jgi:hypothetical protein
MRMDENDELSDSELDRLLRQWSAPAAPERLRAAVFPEGRPGWWGRFWSGSIRVPVPAACAVALALGLAAWRSVAPAARVVVMRTAAAGVPRFQPVLELRPRIVEAEDAAN